MARNAMSRAEVERIMAAQATRKQRLEAADDVIDNGGALATLAPQIAALHDKYLELARIG
jgi:dephospho-CoA kinase